MAVNAPQSLSKAATCCSAHRFASLFVVRGQRTDLVVVERVRVAPCPRRSAFLVGEEHATDGSPRPQTEHAQQADNLPGHHAALAIVVRALTQCKFKTPDITN